MTTGTPVSKGDKVTAEKINKKLEDLVRPIQKVNGEDYNIQPDDDNILVTTGATNRNINLPTAVGRMGKIFVVEKVDMGAGYAVINPFGAETIIGYSYWEVTTQYSLMAMLSDGANWV